MMWNGSFGFADGWSWFWPLHFIIPLLFFGAIIAVVVLFIRHVAGWGCHLDRSERRPRGLDVLEERYARGEINRDEYLQKKQDITG